MQQAPPKLVLPTVATCRWRRAAGPAGSARCGLVASLLGLENSEFSFVPEQACVACCRSYPPSPRHLNPTVASLLYEAAARIVVAGGTAECSVKRAADAKQRAEAALDLVHPARFRLTPVRDVSDCCWLGEALPGAAPEAAQTPGGEPQPETVRVCRHPDHQRTTASLCRLCRDWAVEPPRSRWLSLAELVPPPQHRCGPPIRQWAVGVTTAPRRQATLESCLDALVRAGWEELRLFLDGSVPLPPRYSHLPVTWREASIGAWPAWYMALAELVLQQPEADAYLLLQDDVLLYDRESLRSYLERALWPGERPGLVSLFYTGPDLRPGWHASDEGWHWGAQGFVFPPGVARAFLADSEVCRTWLSALPGEHIPIPSVLHEWVQRTGIEPWYATPSLAQHVGNTSTIWMNAQLTAGRRAAWFSGSVETVFAEEEGLADFPEEAFACPPSDRDEYLRRVDSGYRRMRGLTVVLCGLCRDVRHHLPRTAARVERLGGLFRDYRVVLVENDSVDATREFLCDWQSHNPRVEVISTPLGAPKYPQVRSLERAAFLASCRNRYRQRILSAHAGCDYVIVFDADLPGGWSWDGVAHTFGSSDWDFVGSYGLERRAETAPDRPPLVHFDVWAFRPAAGTAARQLVNHNELHLQRGAPWLPVESCFGGLGVYRLPCLQACEYGGGDCEHVVFHTRLRQAGFDRLFLNPSQIVLYSP